MTPDSKLLVLYIFFTPAVMLALLAVYGLFVVIDLFKRKLLSSPAIYTVSMLLAPFAALIAIGTFLASLLTAFADESILKAVISFAETASLLTLVAAVYIRGHVKPVDKSKCTGNTVYAASKRLILAGTAGTVLYGILMAVQTFECVRFFIGTLGGGSVIEAVKTVFLVVLALLIPIFNIFAFALLIVFGAELAAIGVAAMMMLFMSLLVTNGCIRYIITINTTKVKKLLYILVCFIPIVNIVMGIKYIKQMQ